ncbi:Stk1 family PASTA domain-containing Ser/Thr kinase [Dactylosporangium matsuzakiense]|uniref:PASTA domain-containing protein n=1 Tax=Dactylosporangium matsuzakiense TaxID=53360 RepID=A0A9W6KFD3_9ACTN|nr:Stk1 family PASTA domain-containing Ser/Thr kinase [Dactylosporangium matsuzakiense]UWZ45044.1 PASTA domain-containing protein [Dactylosporangium matsuzakiense]GLK99029.1 hypothetical protein GCM10017581_007700 [Dactylosporangium matsuzakiense]
MANRADQPDDESSTQPFWPFPSGGGPGTDPDATQLQHPTDATQVQRPTDATQVQRPVDATRQVRPTARIVQDGAERERWSARAGVPAPGDPAVRRPAPQEWVEEPEEDPYQGRNWLTPVVVGIVALVLIGALSVGLYLIYRATADGRNAPGDLESSAPAAVSSAPPASSAAPPSSAPPSSEAPPSEGPEPVVIPPLRGNTLAEATVKLQGLGLNVKVERVPDDSLPPGEVLSARPGEGQTVLPGETVTLRVAAAVTTAPSVPQPSASASRSR